MATTTTIHLEFFNSKGFHSAALDIPEGWISVAPGFSIEEGDMVAVKDGTGTKKSPYSASWVPCETTSFRLVNDNDHVIRQISRMTPPYRQAVLERMLDNQAFMKNHGWYDDPSRYEKGYSKEAMEHDIRLLTEADKAG